MIEIRCSALLFDMDGVLIDSTPAVARVWRKWALEHHFDPVEVVARAHGRPSIMTIREYLPDADHEAENRIVERAEMEDLEGVVPLPGARELLAALPPERCPPLSYHSDGTAFHGHAVASGRAWQIDACGADERSPHGRADAVRVQA